MAGVVDRKLAKQLVARLNRDGAHLAQRFGLRFKSIEAERANVKNRYGVCFSDGVIKIRLRHAVTGRPLKYSSMVNTLCHELAHLRHFNHGERFKAFYLEILYYARVQRIYQPRQARGGTATPERRSPGPLLAARSSTPAETAEAAQRARRRDEPRPGKPVQLSLFS